LFSIFRALSATITIEVVIFYTYAFIFVRRILSLIRITWLTFTIIKLSVRIAFAPSRIVLVLSGERVASDTSFIHIVNSVARIARAYFVIFYGSLNTLGTLASCCAESAKIITFSAAISTHKRAFLAHAISWVVTSKKFASGASVIFAGLTERITFHTLSIEFPEATLTAAFSI